MHIGLSALSLAISRSFGFQKRRAFLNEYFLRKQLQTLGAILFDLVPPIYGLQERQKKNLCSLISVVCPIG
jgi:hypothetical protein